MSRRSIPTSPTKKLTHPTAPSNLFDEFRFEAHGAKALDLALDIVVPVDKADILDPRTHLDGSAGALGPQVLDHGDSIAVLQNIPEGIAVDFLFFRTGYVLVGQPFMGTLGANQKFPIVVDMF